MPSRNPKIWVVNIALLLIKADQGPYLASHSQLVSHLSLHTGPLCLSPLLDACRHDKVAVLRILDVGVQVPLLGELQGLLEHFLCVRLEDKLLAQSERGVVIRSL